MDVPHSVVKVKDVVRRVLKSDPRARADDTWLILQVLRSMGYAIFIPYEKMDGMPAFESITRCRRKIQEEGDMLPSDSVLDGRAENRERMREMMSGEFDGLG